LFNGEHYRSIRSATPRKPQQPPNDFFDCFHIYNPDHYGDRGKVYCTLIDIKTISLTPEDALLRDYGVVAVLFNKYAEEHGETPVEPEILSDIEIPAGCETLWEKEWSNGVKPALVNALKAVNQDLASEQKKKEKPPLGEKAAAVYEILKALPEHKALTGKEILQQLEEKGIITDQSTFTKSIIPALRPYGVKNKRGAGYYITANIP
jgi:hypothetical protein